MRALRRLLQVVALVGTLIVGIVAVALIVSQTPWFRDWLRRYIVRESAQYLNGQLSIGGLGGNLFFCVQLSDVAFDIARVVKEQRKEADREGPSRPVSLPSIEITDADVTIEDGAVGTSGYRLPER